MTWYGVRRWIPLVLIACALGATATLASELAKFRTNATVLKLAYKNRRAYKSTRIDRSTEHRNHWKTAHKDKNSYFRSDQLYKGLDQHSANVRIDLLRDALMGRGLFSGPRQVSPDPGRKAGGWEIERLPSAKTDSSTPSSEGKPPVKTNSSTPSSEEEKLLGVVRHLDGLAQPKAEDTSDVERAKREVSAAVDEYKKRIIECAESADSNGRLGNLKKAYFKLDQVIEKNNQYNEIEKTRRHVAELALDVQTGNLAGSPLGDKSWKSSLAKRIEAIKESLKPESKRARRRGPVAGK